MSIFNYLTEMFVNEDMLTEVTADDKYAKQYDGKLDRNDFDKAVALDPTSSGTARVGKYVDWLIKQKDEWIYRGPRVRPTSGSPGLTELADNLELFDKFNSKFPVDRRDINKMSLNIFMTLIKNAKDKGIFESKKDKKKAEKSLMNQQTEFVLKTDKYVILQPKTQKASQYWTMYGGGKEGCSWCTGAKSDTSCHFGDYDKVGDLYIIFDATNKDRKWQMIKADEGEELPNADYDGNTGGYEYRDCSNDGFDPWEEFSDDPKVMAWMRTNEFPEYEPQDEEEQWQREEEELDEEINRMIGKLTNTPTHFDDQLIKYLRDIFYEGDRDIGDINISERDLSDINELFILLDVIGSSDDYIDIYISGYMNSFIDLISKYTADELAREYLKYSSSLRTNFAELEHHGLIDSVSEYLDDLVSENTDVLSSSGNSSEISEVLDYIIEHPKEGWDTSWVEDTNLEEMKDVLLDNRETEDIYKFFRVLGKSHEYIMTEIYDSDIEGDEELKAELERYNVEFNSWIEDNKETNKED